jgi:hypothetical protein
MIVIIPCGAKKRSVKSQAYAMYIGSYFKANLHYALSIAKKENIYILSAKYGLLRLQDEISPYNIRMGQPGCVSGRFVKRQADEMGILEEDVICLGGRDYTSVMREIWPGCSTPLKGTGGMGKQMQWLKWNRGKIPQ